MESEARAYPTAGGIGRAVRSVKACVVFDSATGVIQLSHQVVTTEGAEETPDDQVMRRALALARERLDSGTPLPGERSTPALEGDLDAILVDPSQLRSPRPHRVDVRTRSLVPIDGTAS